ncbi:MAG: arginine--tRNA ligase, partial [Candidatus Bilamarchaeaceae archaeon]
MLRSAKNEIARMISEASGAPMEVCIASLEIPEEKGHGDLASRIGFLLAKERKTSPGAIAHQISLKMKPNEWVEKVEANGPYLNFFFSDAFYSAAISRILEDGPNYGKGRKGKRVIVEFPSVNPNKPWHVGHLRNALLGDSVANLLEFAGNNVQRIDYIDDLGLQVAQSLWGYDNLGGKPEGKFDHWLGEQYVKVAERMETDPEVRKFAEGLLHEMERGGNEVARKARWLAEE